MATVSLEKIEKIYSPGRKDSFRAVKSIDLEVRDKEFMVLVGPSGCGKSTSLRMIAGLEDITSGVMKLGDRVINDVQPKNRDIAMVFQNYALYPHMTVFDNMAFGLKLLRKPRDEIKRRVDEAAAILGLEELLDRKPKALSGGQRQRVAVGRAIVRKPRVFLFDEPLSNLDAKMRVQMRAEISRLHAQLDATMIYVTHDQVEAMTMGDRICVMNNGSIMQVDTPLEIYNHPANMFVAGFIGSPPMNFFSGRIECRDERECLFVEETNHEEPLRIRIEGSRAEQARKLDNRRIIFGIRPEHITLVERSEDAGFRAVVDVAEPMGAETFLYLKTRSQHSFTARVEGTRNFELNQTLDLGIEFENVRFFDPETEEVLTSRE